MRYLIDTNIFVYVAMDRDSLSRDVLAILDEWDTQLYMSVESIRELILLYRNKRLGSKLWKSAEELVRSIEKDYFIKILPLREEHLITYSCLRVNEADGHKDPSDHVIIAHAMTEHLPLISSDRRFEYYRQQGLDLIFNRK
ncbi:MAG: type II toxin-antitoxin system VapC family toxin [Mediterranea sp.]|jgi:PIN domain nuclease of toxin-antitoxin system|nr:type II toxin-antitoxin system VapC family toxin [Mediterranea sp.]